MGDGVPGGEHGGIGGCVWVVVEHALIGLLQQNWVTDQIGELLEHLGHAGPVENQLGEAPVRLLGVLERERLLADDLTVKRLGDLDERDLAVQRDQRQVAGLGLLDDGPGDLVDRRVELDNQSGDLALGQRGDELALGRRTVREPHPGRQQQLSAAEYRGHL